MRDGRRAGKSSAKANCGILGGQIYRVEHEMNVSWVVHCARQYASVKRKKRTRRT